MRKRFVFLASLLTISTLAFATSCGDPNPVDPTTYTVSFNSNGGTGVMATIRRYKGSSYSIPECEFTPPEAQVFKCWCDQPTTDSPEVHVFNVGDSIALNDYADAILLYAIWVDATPPEDEIGATANPTA